MKTLISQVIQNRAARVALAAVAAAGLSACGGDDDDDDIVFPSDNTIADIVIADERFTTLETALSTAGLVDALEAPADTFTVFAPTDAAFALIPEADLNALLADNDALTATLLYHVVQGKELDAGEIVAGGDARLETMSGKYIDVDVEGEAGAETVMVENATVTITDIEADNGIIHVIDAVLMPADNLVEVASAAEPLSTLVSAVAAAGLVDTLSDEAPGFTVFAPTNDAFAAISETVTPLLDTINSDDATDDEKAEAQTALQSVLTYHVLTMQVDSTAAVAAAPLYVETVNGGSLLVDTDDSGNLKINGVDVVPGSVDIEASNGIVHLIDEVLLPKNIVETLQNDSRFETLVTAVVEAELVDTLSAADGMFTVFAPTDAAFEALPEGTLASLLEPENQAELQGILTYHVLDSMVDSATALTLDGQRATTVNGKQVRVSVNDGGTDDDASDDMLMIDGATVTITDIKTSNGIIHVIDTVLLPKDNLVEIAQSDDRFETLVAAVVAADLVETLSDEEGTFTLFAPTDDAFAALEDGVLDSLLMEENKDQLIDILTYHVLPVEVAAETVLTLNGESATTVQGDDVTISVDGSMVDVNDANVIEVDIMGSNGIIHVIDSVLLPPAS